MHAGVHVIHFGVKNGSHVRRVSWTVSERERERGLSLTLASESQWFLNEKLSFKDLFLQLQRMLRRNIQFVIIHEIIIGNYFLNLLLCSSSQMPFGNYDVTGSPAG